MKLQRIDSISIDNTYYTEEGYLVDHPIVTTCGIFEYKNNDGSIRRELRLPEDVFDAKSLESYKGKPIIITHDAGEVDKNNVHREQIGTIMSKGYRDGDNVRCEIIIHDTNALERCGLKELSLGYSLDTDDTPGVYRGEKYDCIQKNIEINHLALVGEARAGESARLNIDGKDEDVQILKGGMAIMYKPNAKGRRADDGAELSPEEMEAAIALFKAQQAASQATGEETDGEVEEASGEEQSEEKSPVEQVRENIDRRDSEGEEMTPEDIIAEQKADLDTLLEEIDKLQATSDMNGDDEKDSPADENAEPLGDENTDSEEESGEAAEEDKGVNMDSVDRIIQARLDVCRMADKLHLDGVEKLSVKEGRKQVIKAVNPKINLDGKSDSYINAAYDIAKQSYRERKSTDDQRKKIATDKVRRDAKEESNSIVARKNMISKMTGGKK
ncbi:MAG: DUF2213 domain-containing protein [Clostridiaceae bacterium]|nr:DUF2213 domain-containing protein [Clostridiaceae bacterium]